MARIINRVPFHWAQSARQRPHYPVDNWSVLPFISILNAIKCHHWLSNLPSALGSGCLLRQAGASQIPAQCSARCSQRRPSHHTLIFSTWLLQPLWPRRLQNTVSTFHGAGMGKASLSDEPSGGPVRMKSFIMRSGERYFGQMVPQEMCTGWG